MFKIWYNLRGNTENTKSIIREIKGMSQEVISRSLDHLCSSNLIHSLLKHERCFIIVSVLSQISPKIRKEMETIFLKNLKEMLNDKNSISAIDILIESPEFSFKLTEKIMNPVGGILRSCSNAFDILISVFDKLGRSYSAEILGSLMSQKVNPQLSKNVLEFIDRIIQKNQPSATRKIVEILLPNLDWLMDQPENSNLVSSLISNLKNKDVIREFELRNQDKPTQLLINRSRRKVFLTYLQTVQNQRSFLEHLVEPLLSNRSDLRYILKREESIWLLLAALFRLAIISDTRYLNRFEKKVSKIMELSKDLGACAHIVNFRKIVKEIINSNLSIAFQIINKQIPE